MLACNLGEYNAYIFGFVKDIVCLSFNDYTVAHWPYVVRSAISVASKEYLCAALYNSRRLLFCGKVRYDGIHFTAQKTGKRGLAPISEDLRRALRRGKAGDWLFPSPYKIDRHLTRQAVWERIKRGAKVAGVDLEGVSPHALRKSFAVELYREKGFKAVQAALQHRNAATTEIYSFADWSTGENADKPLCRRDLQLVVKMVLEALGGCTFEKESRPRKRS